MSRTFDMSNLIDAMENKDSNSRKASLEDDDNDDDIDEEEDDDDTVYGPYASFDQSGLHAVVCVQFLPRLSLSNFVLFCFLLILNTVIVC